MPASIATASAMLEGYEKGYESQWQRMKAEPAICVPPDSVPAKAFDSEGAAQPLDSLGVVFDLAEAVLDRLIERQQRILRACQRDPALGRCLRPLPRASLHGTIYLAGFGIPRDRAGLVIDKTLRRAREVASAIPEICATLGNENRLGPWIVTHLRPDSEDGLGHWKALQASMGHLELFPVYFIHVSLLVVRRPVENEGSKRILDDVLERVRRESVREPLVPVRIKALHLTWARDFDHIERTGEPLELLSADAYASARKSGYERIARQLGLQSADALADPEHRGQLWALRGYFPDYFWPNVDAMMASVGSGAVDPAQLAGLMQARKLATAVVGGTAVPVVQVRGLDATPRVGVLHALIRAVEACELPVTILHQVAQSRGLDLQLVFEREDEARLAAVAHAVARLPDLPPPQPAPAVEAEPLSLSIKLPRGLGRLGDILQALDKYDPRIAVTLLLGHPHWEAYDWLDLDLVIPKGRKDEVKKLVRFWCSYRYTDTLVWVAEKGEEAAACASGWGG